MNAEFIISQLEKNHQLFKVFLELHEHEFIRWKQAPEKWCMLEIVCHLCDEEREDFRMRVDLALHRSSEELQAIDPQGWVQSRKYMEQDYFEKVKEFMHEREKSIHWLKSLNEPIWDAFFTHPKLGKMTAYYILSNWLAHDYLHFKQILRLKYDYLAKVSSVHLNYAGDWV
ncbi:MAG: DinB family protein [Saprospiraceae bacterium]|nr:DinB family protein [Saprospiraceae bacterium]